jgi:hypothetical protein
MIKEKVFGHFLFKNFFTFSSLQQGLSILSFLFAIAPYEWNLLERISFEQVPLHQMLCQQMAFRQVPCNPMAF